VSLARGHVAAGGAPSATIRRGAAAPSRCAGVAALAGSDGGAFATGGEHHAKRRGRSRAGDSAVAGHRVASAAIGQRRHA
jgi:hypothetical protein